MKFGEQTEATRDGKQSRSVRSFDHVRLLTDFASVATALKEQWPDAAGKRVTMPKTGKSSYIIDLTPDTIVPIIIDVTHSSVVFERRTGLIRDGVCDGVTYRDLNDHTTRPCWCEKSEKAEPCSVWNRITGHIILSTQGQLHSVWLASHSRAFAQELAALPETDDPLLVGVHVVERQAKRRTADGKVELRRGKGPAIAYAAPIPAATLRQALAEVRTSAEWTEFAYQLTARLAIGLRDDEDEMGASPESILVMDTASVTTNPEVDDEDELAPEGDVDEDELAGEINDDVDAGEVTALDGGVNGGVNGGWDSSTDDMLDALGYEEEPFDEPTPAVPTVPPVGLSPLRPQRGRRQVVT